MDFTILILKFVYLYIQMNLSKYKKTSIMRLYYLMGALFINVFIYSCEDAQEEVIPSTDSYLGTMWTAFYPEDFSGPIDESQGIESISIEFISQDQFEWWYLVNGMLESDGTTDYQWYNSDLYINPGDQGDDYSWVWELNGTTLSTTPLNNINDVLLTFHKQ